MSGFSVIIDEQNFGFCRLGRGLSTWLEIAGKVHQLKKHLRN
jgi:hypothetical protein